MGITTIVAATGDTQVRKRPTGRFCSSFNSSRAPDIYDRMRAAADQAGEDRLASATRSVSCGSIIGRRAALELPDRVTDGGRGQLQSLGCGAKLRCSATRRKVLRSGRAARLLVNLPQY